MTTQFITNNKGEKTAVIIPIDEYEDLLHQHHLNLELTDEYKTLMDAMLDEEDSGKAKYVSFQSIKDRFTGK
jgi:PHD/YefM family antitoxin component YafN of YafNO toxin-antitoxin module